MKCATLSFRLLFLFACFAVGKGSFFTPASDSVWYRGITYNVTYVAETSASGVLVLVTQADWESSTETLISGKYSDVNCDEALSQTTSENTTCVWKIPVSLSPGSYYICQRSSLQILATSNLLIIKVPAITILYPSVDDTRITGGGSKEIPFNIIWSLSEGLVNFEVSVEKTDLDTQNVTTTVVTVTTDTFYKFTPLFTTLNGNSIDYSEARYRFRLFSAADSAVSTTSGVILVTESANITLLSPSNDGNSSQYIWDNVQFSFLCNNVTGPIKVSIQNDTTPIELLDTVTCAKSATVDFGTKRIQSNYSEGTYFFVLTYHDDDATYNRTNGIVWTSPTFNLMIPGIKFLGPNAAAAWYVNNTYVIQWTNFAADATAPPLLFQHVTLSMTMGLSTLIAPVEVTTSDDTDASLRYSRQLALPADLADLGVYRISIASLIDPRSTGYADINISTTPAAAKSSVVFTATLNTSIASFSESRWLEMSTTLSLNLGIDRSRILLLSQQPGSVIVTVEIVDLNGDNARVTSVLKSKLASGENVFGDAYPIQSATLVQEQYSSSPAEDHTVAIIVGVVLGFVALVAAVVLVVIVVRYRRQLKRLRKQLEEEIERHREEERQQNAYLEMGPNHPEIQAVAASLSKGPAGMVTKSVVLPAGPAALELGTPSKSAPPIPVSSAPAPVQLYSAGALSPKDEDAYPVGSGASPTAGTPRTSDNYEVLTHTTFNNSSAHDLENSKTSALTPHPAASPRLQPPSPRDDPEDEEPSVPEL